MSRFVKIKGKDVAINADDIVRFDIGSDTDGFRTVLNVHRSAGPSWSFDFENNATASDAFNDLCSQLNLIRYRADMQTGPRKPDGGWDKAYRSFDSLAGFGVCTESGT